MEYIKKIKKITNETDKYKEGMQEFAVKLNNLKK